MMTLKLKRGPNHALQRTAAGHRGCNRCASWPPSLSLGRWAAAHRAMKTVIAYALVVIGIRVLVVLLMGALVGIPIV